MIHMEIHIKGKLDPRWSSWFEDLQICPDPSQGTRITGNLPDQAAVYGVISRLSSLGIALVSVTCEEIRDQPPP